MYTSDDVNIIFNLRNAWNFVLLNIDTKIDIDFIKKLHEKIALNQALEVGKFRAEESIVYIGGTEFKPKSISEYKILKKINNVLDIKDILTRALEYYALATKSQFFWDGNKRCASLIVNKILIENGLGIFSIRPEQLEKFNKLLSEYYTDDIGEVKLLKYISNNLIHSMENKELIISENELIEHNIESN